MEMVEGWLQGRFDVEDASKTSRMLREDRRNLEMANFEYRATSPLYADAEIQFFGEVRDGKGSADDEIAVDIWAVQGSTTGMRGTATIRYRT